MLGVAGDVADRRIELRHSDLQAIGGPGGHVHRSSVDRDHQQSKPLCKSAQASTSPHSSSDKPTAADAMSLMRPMASWWCGVTWSDKLLDRGVEKFDNHQHQHDTDQCHPPPCLGRDQERRRHSNQQRGDFLTKGLLRFVPRREARSSC